MKKKKVKTIKQELQFPKQLQRENIFPSPDDSFEFSNPLNKENYFTPSTKIEDDDF